MPFEFKREGNTCDKCQKPNTEVGTIIPYTDPHDGYEGLLCAECIKKREKPYKEICPKCKRLAYEHGGMSFYGEPPYNDEKMCLECVEKKEKNVAKQNAMKLKIKNFVKDRWQFLFFATLGILALLGTLSIF